MYKYEDILLLYLVHFTSLHSTPLRWQTKLHFVWILWKTFYEEWGRNWKSSQRIVLTPLAKKKDYQINHNAFPDALTFSNWIDHFFVRYKICSYNHCPSITRVQYALYPIINMNRISIEEYTQVVCFMFDREDICAWLKQFNMSHDLTLKM